MKNDELEDLTRLADAVANAIPRILYDGEGLVDENGSEVDVASLLAPLFVARKFAVELHERLKETPRRKMSGGASQ